MKRLFVVTIEWKLAGKGEEYHRDKTNVVAVDAMTAVTAAITALRDGFVEKLADVRLSEVAAGALVDLIV